MKKVILWFFLCSKRYLKRIPFLLLLAALPLTALAASRMENGKDGTVRIAVCCLDPEPASLGNRLKENLLARDTGLFSFYPCENEQQVRDHVAARKAECGYLIPENLEQNRLKENLLARDTGLFSFYPCENEQQVRDHVAARKAECGYLIPENLEQKINSGRFKRSITVFSAPSTVTASLSTEVVFSELAAIRNKDILEDYAEQGAAFDALGAAGSPERKKASGQAGDLYKERMEDGSTFRFEYVYTYSPKQTGNGSGETGTAAPSPGLFPVRGLTAVFLFITGLYSAVTAAEDSRRGLFIPLPVRLRLPCRFAALAAPVALAALSGLSAVLLSGGPGISSGGAAAILPEAAAMALYALAVSIFSMALGAVLKTPEALGAAIPFFIIGSLIFCPVFFDAERLLPGLGQAGRLFLPYYYLRGFFHWP